MPVFSKGLLCSGGSRADGKRRSGCLAHSEEEDDSSDAVFTRAPATDAAITQPWSKNNVDLEVQPGSSNAAVREEDEGENCFRFFLTLADLQFPDPEIADLQLPDPEITDLALVEIEGEGEGEPQLAPEVGEEDPSLEETTPLATEPTTAATEPTTAATEPTIAATEPTTAATEPTTATTDTAATTATATPDRKSLKRSARSSCGRASSPKEDESLEEEGPTVTPEPNDEKFLILLTGLLAHEPPPPDDFRFFLTVHQAEAAT